MAADACVQMPPKGSGNRKFGGSGRRKAGHADKKGVRGRGQDGRGHRGHDGQYPQPKAAKVDWDKHCEEHFERNKNPRGRSRTYHEICTFLCAVFKLRALHKSGALANLANAVPADCNGDMIKYVHFVGLMMGVGDLCKVNNEI